MEAAYLAALLAFATLIVQVVMAWVGIDRLSILKTTSIKQQEHLDALTRDLEERQKLIPHEETNLIQSNQLQAMELEDKRLGRGELVKVVERDRLRWIFETYHLAIEFRNVCAFGRPHGWKKQKWQDELVPRIFDFDQYEWTLKDFDVYFLFVYLFLVEEKTRFEANGMWPTELAKAVEAKRSSLYDQAVENSQEARSDSEPTSD